jgi:membrane fusion protein (multidrug efflux system)
VVPVREAYTANVTAGTEVPFSLAAYPVKTFAGRVVRIAHSVDVSTRTMAVELDVNNRDTRLAPGSFCAAEIRARTDVRVKEARAAA